MRRNVTTFESYRWPGNGDASDLKYNEESIEFFTSCCEAVIATDEKAMQEIYRNAGGEM